MRLGPALLLNEGRMVIIVRDFRVRVRVRARGIEGYDQAYGA